MIALNTDAMDSHCHISTGGRMTVGPTAHNYPVRVLVIGSGAREHALVQALRRDPGVSDIVAAPGNPGMAGQATLRPVDPADAQAVVALARQVAADLVVIGPEVPLVLGVADA